MPPCNEGAHFLKDYRLCFFLSAIFLYGTFSSPTPDQPRLVELVISLLFMASVGVGGIYQNISGLLRGASLPKWKLSGLILFLYGLIVPTVVALYHDASFSIVVRDLIAFIFLCLPLFVLPFLINSEKRQSLFEYGLLFIGLAFAVRVLFLDFSFFTEHEELLYLANSPLVLLSGLYFTLMALDKISTRYNMNSVLVMLGCVGVAILPMAAMYIDFQRASFLALGASIFMFLGLGLIRTPLRTALSFSVLLGIAFIFYPYIADVIENISVKTSKVGLNMRYQEWLAVWSVAMAHPMNLLFGQGWGAEFASPAVGGLNVSYTHSLITYMLLKTGIIGLGLTLVYVLFIFEKVVRLVFIKTVKGSALIWPFIIPIMLYASYKSLDYGLVLTLILLIDIKLKVEPK